MTRILFDDRVLLALFIVLGAYYLVGVFPLTPVFGDGIDVANGATHMSRTHIESTPLGYRYSQHPGAHVLLAFINRISGADTHTVFLILCAACAALFVFVSACLVSSLIGSSIGLAGISILLFQEASAAAYYGNTNVLAGAIGICGLYILHRQRAGVLTDLAAGLLLGLSFFFRLDAALLALVAMPLLYKGDWSSTLLRTVRVAVFSVLLWWILYSASGASLRDVIVAITFKEDLFAAEQDWGNTVRSHIAYFSVLVVVMIAVGLAFLIRNKRWKILAVVGAGILPFYIVFPDGVDTPRYLYYALPFWALLVAQSLLFLRSISSDALRNATVIVLLLLFSVQYLVGIRILSADGENRTRAFGDIPVSDGRYLLLRPGPGEHAVAPSINGGRLSSGLLYAPLWHKREKTLKRSRANGLHEVLSAKQQESYSIRVMGWTEATLVRWSLLKQGYEFQGVTDDFDQGTSEYRFVRDNRTVREIHYRVRAVRNARSNASDNPIRSNSEAGDLFVVRRRELAELMLAGNDTEWHQVTRLAYERAGTEDRKRHSIRED